jgi:hypothetical protein
MKDHVLSSNDFFGTYDLGLAAGLVTAGFVIDHLNRQEQRVQFVFARSESLDNSMQAYWTDELRLSPLKYFSTLKVLKNRIYSE